MNSSSSKKAKLANPSSSRIDLRRVLPFVPLRRSNASAIARTSKSLSTSMLPGNVTKAGQVKAIVNLIKRNSINWVAVVQNLIMPTVLNVNPGRKNGESNYIRPREEKIKSKLLAFSQNPEMSFKDFLSSLTLQELGIVLQVVEQVSEVPKNNRVGIRMEFVRPFKTNKSKLII